MISGVHLIHDFVLSLDGERACYLVPTVLYVLTACLYSTLVSVLTMCMCCLDSTNVRFWRVRAIERERERERGRDYSQNCLDPKLSFSRLSV